MADGVALRPRWARPVREYGHEDRAFVLRLGDTKIEFPLWQLYEDDKERVRLGYVCIKCLNPHERPYPEECEICLLPMRALQDLLFLRLYVGEVNVGPSTTLEEEFEMLLEQAQRKRHNPHAHIWVPGDRLQ